jgi:hypothetical protein
MSDPVSSLNISSSVNACIDDGEASTVPTVVPPPPKPGSEAQGPAPSADPVPTAVPGLVAKFAPSTATKPTASAAPPLSIVTRSLVASAGAVPGGGSYRVLGTLLKQDIESGALRSSLEIASASVQYGKDNDVQATLLRQTAQLGHGDYRLSLTGDAAAARANLGEHNDDGSIGGNIGSGLEVVGGEATIDTPYGSLTGGLSLSASLSGSMGVRDADHDGKLEFCAKFSIPAFTVGACVEKFW